MLSSVECRSLCGVGGRGRVGVAKAWSRVGGVSIGGSGCNQVGWNLWLRRTDRGGR